MHGDKVSFYLSLSLSPKTRRKCEEEHAVRIAQKQMRQLSLDQHSHTNASSAEDAQRRLTLTHALRNAIRAKLSKSPSDTAHSAHTQPHGRSFSQAHVSGSHTQSSHTHSSRSQSVAASSPSEDEVARGCRQS